MPANSLCHMGHRIERTRRLFGFTQARLAKALGVSRQAISKLEQTEIIDPAKWKQVAMALELEEEGLLRYDESMLLPAMSKGFPEQVSIQPVAASSIEPDSQNIPIDQTIEHFEKLLQIEKEKFENSMGRI